MKKSLKLFAAGILAAAVIGGGAAYYSSVNSANLVEPVAIVSAKSNAKDIKLIQTKLKRWGYYSGAVDGIYGSETEAQIRNFQRYVGLPPTGILDQTTFESLVDANSAIDIITGVSVPISPYERNLAGRVVSKGEIHDLVTMLQIMLQTISVATDDILFVKVNGQFDDNTQAAVERIQELNGLPRTGDVDLITWNRLSRLYNKYVDSEGI